MLKIFHDYVQNWIYAEVETCVAGSLEAEGLPGCPQKLACWNKRDDALTKLFITLLHELLDNTYGLKLYMKCLHYQSKISMSVQVEGWQVSPS